MNCRWKRLLWFFSFPSRSVQWMWSTQPALKMTVNATKTFIERVLGVRRPDPEAYHSHASSARTGVSGAVAMLPPCLHGMHGESFAFIINNSQPKTFMQSCSNSVSVYLCLLWTMNKAFVWDKRNSTEVCECWLRDLQTIIYIINIYIYMCMETLLNIKTSDTKELLVLKHNGM
jgi:hypothetical protein